jgi:hypothetical protein
MKTDHRFLWVDVSFAQAFGHNMPTLHCLKSQRLHCKDPRLIDNYIHLFHQYASHHDLFKKVNILQNTLNSKSRSQVQQEYEELDIIRCQVASFAELKCRKLRKGQVAFSPEMNTARLQVKAWSLILQRIQGQKVSSRLIFRMLRKVQLQGLMRGLSKEEVTLELEKAYNKYYTAKSKSVELCQTHLELLAEAHAQRGNISQEKMLKALHAREAQRATARHIKFLRGKTRSGSTVMVMLTDHNGGKKDITDRREMEWAILCNNAEKFSQSSHTPFYQDPLKQEFGLKGLTMA